MGSSSTEALKKRCIKLTAAGRPAAGLQAIENRNKQTPVNIHIDKEGTIAKLQALHPCEDDGDMLPNPTLDDQLTCLKIDDETFNAVINDLSRLSAGGMSGWTYDVIKQLLMDRNHSTNIRLTVQQLITSMLQGHGKECNSIWTSSRLLPLSKPNGKLRPIAIGEAWYRVLGRLVAKQTSSKVGQKLLPLQFGIGISGGTEAIIHSLQLQKRHMLTGAGNYDPTDPDVILSIDLKNAYNSIRRGVIYNALAKYLPELQCFFHWAYGVHSPLYLADGTLATTSETGVRQGDPISALVFCIGIQDTLKAVQTKFPKTTIMAYIDDIYITGPRSEVYKAFRYLRPNFRDIGLVVELDKCHLYDNTVDTNDLEWEGCHLHQDGIIVLGSPIGSPEFETTTVDSILTEQVHSVAWIAKELPANTAYKILQTCINARPNFLIRTVLPDHTKTAAQLFDSMVDFAIRDICGLQEDLDTTGQILRGLPLQLGGGSIRRIFETSHPAYAASFLAAIELVPITIWLQALEDQDHINILTTIIKHVVPEFQGFTADGCSFDYADPNTLRDEIPGPWNQLTADADPAIELPGNIQTNKESSQIFNEQQNAPLYSQRHLCQYQDRVTYNTLHESLRTSCPGKAAQLLSASCPKAGSWILGPQSGNPKTFLKPQQYADNIMLRLLQTPINGVRDHQLMKCKCDQDRALSKDEEHSHYLTCPLLHNTRTRRHTAIKDDLSESIKIFPGVSNLTTEQLLPADKRNQPDYKTDISFTKQGKTYHIDLNVSAPVSKEALKTGSADWTGTACRIAVKSKKKKWTKSMRSETGFVPFILEPAGRIGAHGLQLINDTITKPPDGEDPGISIKKWKRDLTLKLSCTIAKYNHFMLEQFRRNVTITQEGRHHKPKAPTVPRTRRSAPLNTSGKKQARETRPTIRSPPDRLLPTHQEHHEECHYEGCNEDEHVTAPCRHCKDTYCLTHLTNHDCPDFEVYNPSGSAYSSPQSSDDASLAQDLAEEGLGPTPTQESQTSQTENYKARWQAIMDQVTAEQSQSSRRTAKAGDSQNSTLQDEDEDRGGRPRSDEDTSSTKCRKSERLRARAPPQ